MRVPDPAAGASHVTQLYECPKCGQRVEANSACCCAACKCEMVNLSKPRDR